MKPVDFRNATFADLESRLAGMRESVLAAWRAHGPGTTVQIAARSEIGLLTLRPRTTELFELGFLTLAEDQQAKGAGTYRVRTYAEHLAWLTEQQRQAGTGQKQFGF